MVLASPYGIFPVSQARAGICLESMGRGIFEGTAGHPEGFGPPGGGGDWLRKGAVSLFFMSAVSPAFVPYIRNSFEIHIFKKYAHTVEPI